MADENVIYDILQDGIGWIPILLICVWLFAALAFLRIMLRHWRNKDTGTVFFLTIWLFGWLGLGGLGFGNVVYQHLKCVSYARSDDHEIVEGRITDFKPLFPGRKGHESFTVKGVTFNYGHADLSRGGYRKESGGGRGPIQDGVYVRVMHHKGRILRLSILNPDQTSK
jgi:hypothetical protein